MTGPQSTFGVSISRSEEVSGQSRGQPIFSTGLDMAVGQNQWYHFGVGAPPVLVYFSGDWDVHWGFAHGHMSNAQNHCWPS